MKSVFITRKIPEIGIAIFQDKGYEVDINPNDRPLTKKELISYLSNKQYDAVLTLLNDKIDLEVYLAAPTVKIFANYASGFDNFDIEEGKSRGVYLSNVPNITNNRVAEFTWSIILALSCRIIEADNFLKQGKYTGWDPMLFQGIRIAGKTLGLIGLGSTGSEVAKIGVRGFGMRIIYHDIVRNNKLENTNGLIYLPTMEEVFEQADFVSLHVPLNSSTHHLVGIEQLSLMKSSAFLVNTSRGAVIDEGALVDILSKNKIAGAGLDVYEYEPSVPEDLIRLDNVVLTPHIASSAKDVREEMIKVAANNIVQVLDGGKPKNLVYN